MAVIWGTICLIKNGASFSANFSTILRVSHEARLTTSICDADADGSDPLPKYLAKAELSFPVSVAVNETAYISLQEVPK